MPDTPKEAMLRQAVKNNYESIESSRAALLDAGLEFGDDYHTVAEGIRLLGHHRDSLVHELKRIKGIVDGAIPK